MPTPLDHSKMSREELLKLLAETQAAKSQAEKRVQVAEARSRRFEELARDTCLKLDRANTKLDRANTKLAASEKTVRQQSVELAFKGKRIAQLEEERQTMATAFKAVEPFVRDFIEDLKARAMTSDPMDDKQLAEYLRHCVAQYYRFAASHTQMLSIFATGNEKLSSPEIEKITKDVTTRLAELEKECKELNLRDMSLSSFLSAIGVISRQQVKEGRGNDVADYLKDVADAPIPQDEESEVPAAENEPAEAPADAADESKTPAEPAEPMTPQARRRNAHGPHQQGRKPNRSQLREIALQNPLTPEVMKALGCTGWETWGEQTFNIKHMLDRLTNRLADVKVTIELGFNELQKVVSTITSRTPVPVSPNKLVGLDTVIELALMQYKGMPIHRWYELCLRKSGCGETTFLDALDELASIYLDPIVKSIMEELSTANVLLADETTFTCLARQGRGVSLPAGKTSSSNWILALTNMEEAGNTSVAFLPLISRSADSMKLALEEAGFKQLAPMALVTDAFGGYPKLVEDGILTPEVVQICLIHLRRRVCEAAGFSAWKDAMRFLSGQTQNADAKNVREHLEEVITQGHPKLVCYGIVEAIRKIYATEKTLKRKPTETKADHLRRVSEKRRKYSAPLMELIHRGVLKLAPKYAKQTKSGGWVANGEGRDQAISTMVVYALNHWQNLTTFLSHPEVPPDTNAVERKIRGICQIRRAVNHVQSIRGIETLCKIQTVLATAELCGITDLAGWLGDYARALFTHCYEKRWQQEFDEGTGKNPNTKFSEKWDMKKLSEGFKFEDWLPGIYAKKPVRWREVED